MHSSIFISTILVLLTSILSAQNFSLSGELRPRTEYLHGFKSLANADQDHAFWTEQRSRFNFNYTAKQYNVGLVIQDIRVWGSVPQLNKSDNLSSVHEAWGELILDPKWSIKLGRQELMYDDHRILGNVGWAQQARSHDLAKLQFRDSTFRFDFGLAYNQDATKLTDNIYTVNNNYKTMQFLWLHKEFENLGLSFLVLNNGLQIAKPDTTYKVAFSQTLGTHIEYKKDKLKAVIATYYQMGRDGANRDLSAYNLRTELYYHLAAKVNLGIGYELLSGTSQTDTLNKENNSFTPLYGTNHKFNGFMDYFYVGNHANNVGLQDIYFRLKYTHKKLISGIDVHHFSTAENLLDRQQLIQSGEYKAMNAFLGTEIDLTFKYNYSKEVSLQVGYSHLLATETMETLKGGDKDQINNWAYLMVTFKPNFYRSTLNQD